MAKTRKLTPDASAVTLSLLDRILISIVLPIKGNYTQLIIRDELKKKVQLTQEEITNYQVVQEDNGSIRWNELGAKSQVEFTIGELERQELRSALTDLDKKNELTTEHISLYNLFCK